ncbi:MAG: GNAT family N-acetyltransferase [Solirubrobacteraceae bacterium]
MDRDHQTSDVLVGAAPATVVAPCARARTEVLPDGTLIRIEPLRRGDRSAVTGLFARLSPESRLRRFLSPKSSLSEREVTFLADVGRAERAAMTAVDVRDGSILGIARYVEHAGRPGVADTAVAVADEMQRRGIGSALMRRLIACARSNGFHVLTATTLWENRPARALMRTAGFQARASAGAEIELALELDPLLRRKPDRVGS